MQLPASWREMEALYFGGKSKLESAEFVDNICMVGHFSSQILHQPLCSFLCKLWCNLRRTFSSTAVALKIVFVLWLESITGGEGGGGTLCHYVDQPLHKEV